jgi:mono/diheme cytochrome c family protein
LIQRKVRGCRPAYLVRAAGDAEEEREAMRTIVVGAALLACFAAAAASAQDAERGGRLAEAWCSSCHVVAPEAAGGDAGPAFKTVANREGQTLGGIMAWLFEPHPPMPDLMLSPADFRDLAAYIMTLRDK